MNRDLVIGIDLGGTHIKGALLDNGGEILHKVQTATLAHTGPEAVAGRMAGLIRQLAAMAEAQKRSVAGVGVGVPGPCDARKGVAVFAPNLQWENVPLADYLYRDINLPVYLENDANVAALGEQWRGAGRGALNMVMVTIGTGIGGGMILKGWLYRGTNGNAGEIGHTVIDPRGPQCSCGSTGCLETLASATAMIRMAREAMTLGRETVLAQQANLEARDIVIAAQSGDEVARDIINTAARHLGMGLGNIINIINPDTIVIGGGVSKAGEILFKPLRQTALDWSQKLSAGAVRIVPAELGNDAGCVGAARLVFEGQGVAAVPSAGISIT